MLFDLTCDVCGSSDIVETKEGYVCRTCGIVLKSQRLQFNRSYNHKIEQHPRLSFSQIIYSYRKLSFSNTFNLKKLNQIYSNKIYQEKIFHQGKIEIYRIFYCLNLPASLKEFAIDKFKKIYRALNPGTKYRSVERLAPISIYYTLKLHNVSIRESELLEISKISKKEFNAFKLQIITCLPNYFKRNRGEYIVQRILGIVEEFHLGMEFYFKSIIILFKLWDDIKNTTDTIIAGLVCSITALCSYRRKITVNQICEWLGIKMSTIQAQVKKRIFEKFGISGFISLVKSFGLLRKIMVKLKLIEPEIIQIKFRNVRPISNYFYNKEYYRFIFKGTIGVKQFLLLKFYNDNINNNEINLKDSLVEADLLKLSKLNGSPQRGNIKFNSINFKKSLKKSGFIQDFKEFVKFYSVCPICKKKEKNLLNCYKLYFIAKYRTNK